MHKQMDIKKKKISKTNIVVHAGPPDTECLHYPLDMKGVNLIIVIIRVRISISISFIIPGSVLLLILRKK